MGIVGTDEHRALARWAADCAEHVLALYDANDPADRRPHEAVEAARSWAKGELSVGRARKLAFAAHAAAREAKDPVSRAVARAAGQAAATAHVPEHAAHAARYAASAAARSAPPAQDARTARATERSWQQQHLPELLLPRRDQLLDDRPVDAATPEAQRLFVAIWPSAQAVGHLTAALSHDRPGGDDLRWQPSERWHLTLAFLGDADPAAARSVLAGIPLPSAEELRLHGAGTFGPVLWIGVEHGPWLLDLGDAIRTAFHADDGLNQPHLTIARARSRRAAATARDAVRHYASYTGPAWTPPAVTLVRSFTGPKPRYELIESWPLARAE